MKNASDLLYSDDVILSYLARLCRLPSSQSNILACSFQGLKIFIDVTSIYNYRSKQKVQFQQLY